MRHTPALFTALLGAALLAGCGQTPHQPDATAPSPNALRLQHTYEQQKELLGIHPGDEYEITDVTTGLTYSEQHGFRTTELVTVNSRGVATLSSGTSIALTPERGYAAQSVNTQAVCESTTYCPFTRVESLSGYRKISGDLYLPYSVSGLSGGGATYNYYGMRTATQNVELGFYADYQAPSTFYVYIRYKNSAGQDTFAGQQVPSGATGPSAIALGTTVNATMLAPADQQVTLQYTYNGSTKTKSYVGVNGIVQNGAGQYVRRVSSLLLNGSGSMQDKWRNLNLYTSTAGALATSANSTRSLGGNGTNTSSVVNMYYDEDVKLATP